MQEEALMSLKNLRNSGENKGLVISATGTGKTILCALDVRNYNPQKFLFIVHNEGILKKAMKEFKKFFLLIKKRILAFILVNIKISKQNIFCNNSNIV